MTSPQRTTGLARVISMWRSFLFARSNTPDR